MATPQPHSPTLLKPVKPVGIVGYQDFRSLGDFGSLKPISPRNIVSFIDKTKFKRSK